jgi:hypothetical protein
MPGLSSNVSAVKNVVSFGMFVIVYASLTSCGYKPVVGHVAGGQVCVAIVENKTPYPGLSHSLTSALRHRLSTSGIRVVRGGNRVAGLRVTILAVEGRPGMLGTREGHLIPLDSIWRIRADARLTGPDGLEIAGSDQFQVVGRSYSGGNPQAEESLGDRRRLSLVDDLADAVVAYLFEY